MRTTARNLNTTAAGMTIDIPSLEVSGTIRTVWKGIGSTTLVGLVDGSDIVLDPDVEVVIAGAHR